MWEPKARRTFGDVELLVDHCHHMGALDVRLESIAVDTNRRGPCPWSPVSLGPPQASPLTLNA